MVVYVTFKSILESPLIWMLKDFREIVNCHASKIFHIFELFSKTTLRDVGCSLVLFFYKIIRDGTMNKGGNCCVRGNIFKLNSFVLTYLFLHSIWLCIVLFNIIQMINLYDDLPEHVASMHNSI